jgi:hypothetical protein
MNKAKKQALKDIRVECPVEYDLPNFEVWSVPLKNLTTKEVDRLNKLLGLK